MKEDEAKTEAEAHQLLLYVERKDGSYGPLQTGSYLVGNYLDDYFQKRNRYERACLERLLSGEYSPVAYYQELCELTLTELAHRARVSKLKAWLHRKPRHFARMRLSEARRYAEVFDVPLANLFQVVAQPNVGQIVQERTENRAVVVTSYRETEPEQEKERDKR